MASYMTGSSAGVEAGKSALHANVLQLLPLVSAGFAGDEVSSIGSPGEVSARAGQQGRDGAPGR
jgi:hypothetical protein